MTPLAAYLLLFVAVGIGFIFVHLMAGKLVRPNKPDPAKRTIYECGEPTIGSSWIQFDVRFYVVALLFVIFDVEVAFFFPWALVFGEANALAAIGTPKSVEQYKETGERAWKLVPPAFRSMHGANYQHLMSMQREQVERLNELRAKRPKDEPRLKELKEKREAVGGKLSEKEESELHELNKERSELAEGERAARVPQQQARLLAWLALVEIAVFFGVLLVGYAYLWRRGDLAWVRSLAAEQQTELASEGR